MPTQPCSAIIFCLYPLPTHSRTNTLLTLFLPDKMIEVTLDKDVFWEETWLIRVKSQIEDKDYNPADLFTHKKMYNSLMTDWNPRVWL